VAAVVLGGGGGGNLWRLGLQTRREPETASAASIGGVVVFLGDSTCRS
jgi:hypothetical protein